jgi:hypothetical protein
MACPNFKNGPKKGLGPLGVNPKTTGPLLQPEEVVGFYNRVGLNAQLRDDCRRRYRGGMK